MDLFDEMGPMALGSRLKRLADRLLDDARHTYALYGVPLDPRWFPVFFALSRTDQSLSTGELARQIGQSHASVSQVVKEMARQGLATSSRDPADGRSNRIRLSPAGRAVVPQAREQYRDVNAAVETLLGESHNDLLQAAREAETLLARRSMFERVKDEYRGRLEERIRVVDFEPRHAEAFRRLNYVWIEEHFEVEGADRAALDSPKEKILDPGGAILIALDGEEVVGTCALLPHRPGVLELAKMTVAEASRGKQIGWLLGRAAIDRGRSLGARSLYLESNTRLTAALGLYRRLGFQEVHGDPSPYARANIQMELDL